SSLARARLGFKKKRTAFLSGCQTKRKAVRCASRRGTLRARRRCFAFSLAASVELSKNQSETKKAPAPESSGSDAYTSKARFARARGYSNVEAHHTSKPLWTVNKKSEARDGGFKPHDHA